MACKYCPKCDFAFLLMVIVVIIIIRSVKIVLMQIIHTQDHSTESLLIRNYYTYRFARTIKLPKKERKEKGGIEGKARIRFPCKIS